MQSRDVCGFYREAVRELSARHAERHKAIHVAKSSDLPPRRALGTYYTSIFFARKRSTCAPTGHFHHRPVRDADGSDASLA